MEVTVRTTDTPVLPCWYCGNPNDAISDLTGDAVPKPDDVFFCINCGAPSIFTETLDSRKPTDAEIDEILNNDEAVLHIMAIAMLHGVPVLAMIALGEALAGDEKPAPAPVADPAPETDGMRFV